MRKSRQILMVTLVATVLCADRVVQAAPELRPQVQQMATQIVRRLSISFRQTVPSATVYQRRLETSPQSVAPSRAVEQVATYTQQPLSPFQFRLPPPNL